MFGVFASNSLLRKHVKGGFWRGESIRSKRIISLQKTNYRITHDVDHPNSYIQMEYNIRKHNVTSLAATERQQNNLNTSKDLADFKLIDDSDER